MENDSNNVAQFVQLLTENQTDIFSFILSRVPRSADAEDLLQETTKIMWEKFDTFDVDTNFRGWALTIARFNILNYYRKNKKQNQLFDELILANIESISADLVNADDRVDALRQCVKLLPSKQTTLLQMRFTDGIEVKVIAQQLRRSIPGVYKMFAKIQLSLMHCINKRFVMENRP